MRLLEIPRSLKVLYRALTQPSGKTVYPFWLEKRLWDACRGRPYWLSFLLIQIFFRQDLKKSGWKLSKFTLIAYIDDDVWHSVCFGLCLFILAMAVETTITEVDVSQGREVDVQEKPGRRYVQGKFLQTIDK